MIKMLLVGELNDTLHSLSECLKGDFQIQMCSQDAKNIKDMIRIIRPGIMVFNIQEDNENVHEIFEMLRVKMGQMPILVVATPQMESILVEEKKGFNHLIILLRPLKAQDVLDGCYRLLNINVGEARPKEKKAPLVKKKILVVDDNALVLRNIKSLLEGEYEVILATSGEKGLDSIMTKKPDLVLLDYDMPGMNGKEVFDRIRSNESTKDLPVVFLTSVAEREHIMAVLVNSPSGYILKPPSKDKIIAVLKEALGE
ncbi:MAG: response regulator [Lachnospiraceae bacterium]